LKIDKGSPIEFDKSGSLRRINKLEEIQPIRFNRALDLGAGKGAYSIILSNKGTSLIAADINKEFIEELNKRKLSNIDVLLTSGEMTSFKENTFDALFAIEVLEHVENLTAVMKEIRRITKSGSYIYITVPNKYFPLETHHVYFFNKAVDGRYIPILPMIDPVYEKIGSSRRFSIKSLSAIFLKEQFTKVGHGYIMPPFDNLKIGKYLRPVSNIMENSFLKVLSPNIALVFRNIK
jgi:ubiquinone/menaquinone biosynthesis C-methylase UbiE